MRRALPLLVLGVGGCGLLADVGPPRHETDASGLDAAGLDASAGLLDAETPLDASGDASLARLDAPMALLDASSVDASLAPIDALALVPDAFATDAFATDAFATDAFVRDAFVRDAFVPDAFVPDAFVPDAFAPDASASDLVAWYLFDERLDATGHGHTLTTSSVTFSGRAARFGPTSTAFAPHDPDFHNIRAISLWLRPASLPTAPGRAVLVDSEGFFALELLSGGLVGCNLAGGAAVSFSAFIERGAWRHLACSYTGGTMTVSVDGSSIFSGGGVAPPPPTAGPLRIGQDCCVGGDPYDGDLADVRLWRRPPTAAELAAIFAAGPPP